MPNDRRPAELGRATTLRSEEPGLLDELIGEEVVVDLATPFVALGRLLSIDGEFLALGDADLHDLRDGQANREAYVRDSKLYGVRRNRERVLLIRRDVVAVGPFSSVLE